MQCNSTVSYIIKIHVLARTRASWSRLYFIQLSATSKAGGMETLYSRPRHISFPNIAATWAKEFSVPSNKRVNWYCDNMFLSSMNHIECYRWKFLLVRYKIFNVADIRNITRLDIRVKMRVCMYMCVCWLNVLTHLSLMHSYLYKYISEIKS